MAGRGLVGTEIIHLYCDELLSLAEIARRLGVSPEAIGYQLKKHGVPIRIHRVVVPPEQIIAAYQSGGSLRTIARNHGVSTMSILRILKDHGIARRPVGDWGRPRPRLTGDQANSWKGGRSINSDGYVLVHTYPGRPGGLAYELEHRLVWEATHNRKLQPGEDVHHINGDRADNRPENLVALMKSVHMHLHATEDHERLQRQGLKGAAKRWGHPTNS